MKKHLILLALPFLLLMQSCRAYKEPVRSVTQDVERVSVIKETIRDTVVQVQADSALIKALIECDSLGNARIKNILEYSGGDRASPPVLKLNNNVLTVTANTKPFRIPFYLKDTYRIDTVTITKTQTITVTTNHLTWWQQTQIYLGRIFLLIISLVGIAYILRLKKII